MHKSSSRREFIATSLASAALLAAGSRAHAAAEIPPGKKLGYAFVGLGRLTLNQLLPAMAECVYSKAVALVSGHPDKAQQTAAKYNVDPKNIYSYETFDRLKDNPDVDVVFIVLPNGMHPEYTIRAAQAGKHVLCEKPMANTAEECKQMIDACKKEKRKLMIAYRLRHEPYNLHAIEICRAKKYGPVRLITADHGFNIGPNQWRLDKKLAGGGPLMDVGVYCINAASYLTGENPTEVMATMQQPKDDPRFKEVESSITFDLKFPSGIIASCTTTYDNAGGSRYSICAEKGRIDVDPAYAYGGLSMQIRSGGGVEKPQFPQVNQFAGEIDHFSRCILEGTEPVTPGEIGLQDLQAIEAIYASATSGKRVLVAK